MQDEIQNFNIFLEQNDYDAICYQWIGPRQSTDYTQFLNFVSEIKPFQVDYIDSGNYPFSPELYSTKTNSLHSSCDSEQL